MTPELPAIELLADFSNELPVPLQLDSNTGIYEPDQPPFQLVQKLVSPRQLGFWRRQLILWAMTVGAILGSVAVSAYPATKQQLSEKWDISNVAALLGLTTFTTGFALAPMVLAPVSESWGRKPVFAGTGLLFVVCQICCAVTESYGG